QLDQNPKIAQVARRFLAFAQSREMFLLELFAELLVVGFALAGADIFIDRVLCVRKAGGPFLAESGSYRKEQKENAKQGTAEQSKDDPGGGHTRLSHNH